MWDCLVLQVQLLLHPVWLIRAGTCSGSVCVARSQLSPVPHHRIRVLFYASSCLKGKRGCVLQACLLCYPSQYHVVLKAVFRPSCKERDKSNVEVYWPCTAALKLSPEEETALHSCREPSNRDLGQKSRLWSCSEAEVMRRTSLPPCFCGIHFHSRGEYQ